MDYEEFQQFLQAYGFSNLSRASTRRLWGLFDVDGSGEIELAELVEGLNSCDQLRQKLQRDQFQERLNADPTYQKPGPRTDTPDIPMPRKSAF